MANQPIITTAFAALKTALDGFDQHHTDITPHLVDHTAAPMQTLKSSIEAAEKRRKKVKKTLQPLMSLTEESLTKQYKAKSEANEGARAALNQLWTKTLSPAIKQLQTLLAA